MSFFQLPSFISKKQRFEHALKKFIHSVEESNPLIQSVEYALLNGGKRIRPIIVLMIEEALNCPYSIIDAAISIELFHTASLIADDLPTMDNDRMRRERPSTHIEFGETTALLASYGLIALSFEKIADCAQSIRFFDPALEEFAHEVGIKALKVASEAAGLKGATLGQFFDLFPQNGCLIERLIYLKTVTLFEVSFLFGWLFSGGDKKKIEEVKKLAFHFGMAYQIADDLNDLKEDEEKGKQGNFVLFYGKEHTMNQFTFHLGQLNVLIEELGVATTEFKQLIAFLKTEGLEKKEENPLIDFDQRILNTLNR